VSASAALLSPPVAVAPAATWVSAASAGVAVSVVPSEATTIAAAVTITAAYRIVGGKYATDEAVTPRYCVRRADGIAVVADVNDPPTKVISTSSTTSRFHFLGVIRSAFLVESSAD